MSATAVRPRAGRSPPPPAGAGHPEDRWTWGSGKGPGIPRPGPFSCWVRASARGRALRSPSGCSPRAARGRARRDSWRRPVRAAAVHSGSTAGRRYARLHSPPARTPSCRRTRRRVPNAAASPRGARLATGGPWSPSSSRAPVGGRGRRGIAADHGRWALEHRHAANAERADGACRRPAGDSSTYRARRTRPTARRRLHRRARCAR